MGLQRDRHDLATVRTARQWPESEDARSSRPRPRYVLHAPGAPGQAVTSHSTRDSQEPPPPSPNPSAGAEKTPLVVVCQMQMAEFS